MRKRHRFGTSDAPRPAEGVVVGDMQRWGNGWVADEARWRPLTLRADQRCNGFAMAYPRMFAAVYASDGAVWLQLGRQSWNVSQLDRVEQLSERLASASYVLHFTNGATETIRLRMPKAVVAQRAIDPTYDEIDSWFDDIMKLFPYVAPDGWTATDKSMPEWVSDVSARWSSGIKHSGAS